MSRTNTTLAEIAEMTGFSVITVSRALSYPEKVKAKTREKILAVCKEKNYTPNVVARALKTKSTHIVGVYIPEDINVRNPFYTTLVSSIGETLGNRGYSMLLTKKLKAPILCDGMIFTSLSKNDLDYVRELSLTQQVVLFGHASGIDSIDVDNKEGLRIITDEVISRGAKTLLYLSINQDRLFVKDRETGFIESADYFNINYRIDKCLNNGSDAYMFCEKNLMKKYKDVDAIVCASDDIALGVIHFLTEKDIKVPNQIQVTGYDGFGSEHHTFPHIATMRQPIFEIGQMLANRLIEKIESNQIKNSIKLVKPLFINNGSIK